MKRFKDRLLAIFLSTTLILTVPAPAITAYAASSDINGHWAQSMIYKWTSLGYISGYPDGNFKPDSPISRAEFVSLVNRSFHFTNQANISFSDVPTSNWAYADIQKGVGSGYVKGNGNGTFRPNSQVTRQEAAVMLAQVKSLAGNANGATGYKDAAAIASWAKNYVGAVSQAQIMQGFPDGNFGPTSSMTRAETVIALDKALSATSGSGSGVNTNPPNTSGLNTGINTTPGTGTSSTTNGSSTVDTSTISDKVYSGNLTIPRDSARTVTLKNVTVKGTLTVEGGTTINADNCDINKLVLDKSGVTFKADSKTTVKETYFQANGTIEGTGYESVIIEDDGATTVSIDATVDSLELDTDAKLKLLSDADIDTMEVTKNADNTSITFSKGAVVNDMDIYDKVRIIGKGKIKTMTVYVDGVRTEIRPDSVKTKDGADDPTYTSSGSSSSDRDDYDDLTIDDDNDDFDGDGDRYNNVNVEVSGSRVNDMIVYGDLTIERSVGDGTVVLEDVDVRGNVYVYGGGQNSIIFRGCDLQGDIISDTSNKDVSSKDRQEPVALKFDDSTKVSGKVRILGNTILRPDSSSSSITLPRVLVERTLTKELYVDMKVTTIDVDRTALITLGSSSEVNTINVNNEASGTEITFISNATKVGTIRCNARTKLSGNGSVGTIVALKEVEIGSGIKYDQLTQTEDVKVTGVSITPNPANVALGKTSQLTAVITPTNATNKAVTWKSSQDSIVTVSQAGLMTGVALGSATITATTTEGAKIATVTVTVTEKAIDPPAPGDIDLSSLELAITTARQAMNEAVIAEKASDVEKDQNWTTRANLNILTAALGVADNAKTTVTTTAEAIAAGATLMTAVQTYRATFQKGTKVDTTVNKKPLQNAINLSQTNRNDTPISETGVEVSPNKKWALKADSDAYLVVIDAAIATNLNQKSTQSEVDEAEAALKKADGVFNSKLKTGLNTPERDTLRKLIVTKRSELNVINVSDDGIGLPINIYWATQSVIDTYKAALNDAEKVVIDPASTEFATATGKLETATTIFNNTKKLGFTPVKNITLTSSLGTVGTALKLLGTVEPDASFKSIKWSFAEDPGDKGIAIKDDLLTADKPCKVKVLATIEKGLGMVGSKEGQDISYTQQFEVEMKAAYVTSLTINTTEGKVGEKLTLGATVIPSSATQPIEWKIAGTNSAEAEFADNNQALIAKKPGTVIVTATIKNGKFDEDAKEVSDFVSSPTTITFVDSNTTVTLQNHDNVVFAGTGGSVLYDVVLGSSVAHVNSSDLSLEWLDDSNQVTAAPSGVTSVLTKNAITINIDTTAKSGIYKFNFCVKAPSGTTQKTQSSLSIGFMPVSSKDTILISKEATSLEPLDLKATIKPDNATHKNIEWSLASPSGTALNAKVENGKLTASTSGSTGTAIVTATVKNGSAEGVDFTKNFTVNVNTPTKILGSGETITIDSANNTIHSFTAVLGTGAEIKKATNPTIEWEVGGVASNTPPLGIDLAEVVTDTNIKIKILPNATPGTYKFFYTASPKVADYTKNIKAECTFTLKAQTRMARSAPLPVVPQAPAEAGFISVTDIKLNTSSGEANKALKLDGTILPNTSTILKDKAEIKWELSKTQPENEALNASLEDGKLTVSSAGQIKVTAVVVDAVKDGKSMKDYTKDFVITFTDTKTTMTPQSQTITAGENAEYTLALGSGVKTNSLKLSFTDASGRKLNRTPEGINENMTDTAVTLETDADTKAGKYYFTVSMKTEPNNNEITLNGMLTITEPIFTPVTSITCSTITGKAGEPLELKGTVLPAESEAAKNSTEITWELSNTQPKDAAEDVELNDNILTANSEGKVNVTAIVPEGIKNGNKTDDFTQEFTITFTGTPITLSPSTKTVTSGETAEYEVNAESSNKNETDLSFIWIDSNGKELSVLPEGLYETIGDNIITIETDLEAKAGNYQFMITSENSSGKNEKTVIGSLTVTAPKFISVQKIDCPTTGIAGKPLELKGTIYPASAEAAINQSEITWELSERQPQNAAEGIDLVDGVLTVASEGQVLVSAVVEDAMSVGDTIVDFRQDILITFIEGYMKLSPQTGKIREDKNGEATFALDLGSHTNSDLRLAWIDLNGEETDEPEGIDDVEITDTELIITSSGTPAGKYYFLIHAEPNGEGKDGKVMGYLTASASR